MSLETSERFESSLRALREPQSSPLDSILRLGNVFELDFSFDAITIEREIEQFAGEWKQYNPYKPKNPRTGLSLTSLDGGLSGKPDLYSLREYYLREGKQYRERDFSTPTPVYHACKSIQPMLELFRPYLGRTHFLRFEAGGYFPPHRDGSAADETDTFRIFVPLHGVSRNNFVFLYNEERLVLEIGCTYFINTLVNHSLFAFAPITVMVCNVVLNHETVKRLKSVLAQR